MGATDIDRRLLKVYVDDTVDVSIVSLWLGRFNSGKNAVHDKPRPGRYCSTVPTELSPQEVVCREPPS